MSVTKAPKHLSPEAKKWWQRIMETYDISDDGGQWILQTACEAYQRMSECKAILDRDGLTVEDRHGQKKPHPLIPAERDARAAMLSALKQLNLDLEPLNDRSGRPAGR